MLRNAGEDVTTMKSNGTQEDRSIQALFDQMRDEVARVLGQEFAFEIENLFLFRSGPGIRHVIAHGQYSTGQFYSNDAIYACWLIFQLTFLMLIPYWDEVASYLDSNEATALG